MPQPGLVHVNRPLTNISVAYMQEQSIYVAPKVFPVVPVEKDTDLYWVLNKHDLLRDEAQPRGDNQPSAGSGFTLSTSPYQCDVWAFHKDIGHLTMQRADADAGLELESTAARYVTQVMLTRQEMQWMADYFVTGVWGTTVTGGVNFVVWSDPTSDPEEDIETGKAVIAASTGFLPNTLVLGYNVFRRLKRHPVIKDQFKYTDATTITEQMLARFFEVSNVYVARAIRTTSVEGAVTQTTGFVAADNALLCYVAPNPGLLVPSAGYIFSWTGVSMGLGETIGTDSFYIREQKTQRVESEIAFDDRLVGTDLGYMFLSAA